MKKLLVFPYFIAVFTAFHYRWQLKIKIKINYNKIYKVVLFWFQCDDFDRLLTLLKYGSLLRVSYTSHKHFCSHRAPCRWWRINLEFGIISIHEYMPECLNELKLFAYLLEVHLSFCEDLTRSSFM